MKPPLKVRYTGGECRLIPENPPTQCPGRVGLVPVFTHSRMPLDIPCPTSHILVLRKVAVARSPERNHMLLPALVKDCIPLLALGPRPTQSLQAKAAHCKKIGLFCGCPFRARRSTAPTRLQARPTSAGSARLQPPSPEGCTPWLTGLQRGSVPSLPCSVQARRRRQSPLAH